MPALSMFSNAGIGDYGYRLAGFNFHAHAELVEGRLKIAKLNHPRSLAVAGDLRETVQEFIRGYLDRAKGETPALLTGCSPCQGMSTASAWARKGDAGASADPRNALPFLIADVAEELRPRIVVVENVPNIYTTQVRDPRTRRRGYVFDLLRERLDDYHAFPVTLQFADYGVPQRRRRAVFTFIRRGERSARLLRESGTVPYPSRTHDVTSRDGLLPWVTADAFLRPPRYRALDSASKELARDPSDNLHYVPFYEAARYELIRSIPPGSGRSAYETDHCPHCGLTSIPRDLVLCPHCMRPLHTRPITIRDGRVSLISGHKTSYKRMPIGLPASTITTANGHVGSDTKIHPWENRLLSPRECADLQTIPRSFKWSDASGKLPHNELLRSVIGEAVPPWFTYLHGLALYSLLHGGLAAPYLMKSGDYSVEPAGIMGGEERKRERRRRLHRHSGKARRARNRLATET